MEILRSIITAIPFLKGLFRRSLAKKIRQIRKMEQKGEINKTDAARLIEEAYKNSIIA